MPTNQTTLSEQVRREIEASKASRYQICKSIGLQEASMSRFMAGTGGLSLAKLEALVKFLGLELRAGGGAREQ